MQILQDHIDTLMREVVDSGFKRDLDDYISSLPAAQNNIVQLREIGKLGDVVDKVDWLPAFCG